MSLLPTSVSLPLLKSRNVLLVTLFLGVIYLLIQIYFFNQSLISHTLLGNFPLTYKFHLSFDLFTGYFVMFPLSQVFFTIAVAILVGLNLTLMIVLMQRMKAAGNMKFSVGGVGVAALVSSGCPGCGLTLLSLLGPSTGILAITLHSTLIQFTILAILIFSILYSLKKIEESFSCALPLKKSR
jgi:hypothetical protein